MLTFICSMFIFHSIRVSQKLSLMPFHWISWKLGIWAKAIPFTSRNRLKFVIFRSDKPLFTKGQGISNKPLTNAYNLYQLLGLCPSDIPLIWIWVNMYRWTLLSWFKHFTMGFGAGWVSMCLIHSWFRMYIWIHVILVYVNKRWVGVKMDKIAVL